MLVALGIASVQAGHKVRYFAAASLVETLYRAWPTLSGAHWQKYSSLFRRVPLPLTAGAPPGGVMPFTQASIVASEL